MMSNVEAEAAPTGSARAPPQHHQDADRPNGAEDKFERFERWLRENGAYFPEVSWVPVIDGHDPFDALLCHHLTCRNFLV